MREIAREPEELELEGEDERLQSRLRRKLRLDVVQQVEEPRERVERSRLRLLLDEEAQHCLEPDVADGEPVRIRARTVVRADQLRPADRVQVAPALVQQQLDVGERLEPTAEARLGLADSLGDRAGSPLASV